MALMNNITALTDTLLKLPQRRIAQAICICLLIYIAFLVAKITWLMIPSSAQAISPFGVTQSQVNHRNAQDQKHDLAALVSLNLFGEYNQQITTQTVEQITSAPETRLQLTLSGLVASDDVNIAAAVIEHKKQQTTYGIDDIIEGTRASLEQVLTDRVIIKQSGRLETLMLDGADYNQPAQRVLNQHADNTSAQNPQSNTTQGLSNNNAPELAAFKAKTQVVDQRTNEDFKRAAQLLRDDLNNSPGKITDYLRITPVRNAGKISGYRLSPGKKPDFFTLSGLKSGDVAIEMNGHDLRVPLEAAQAMSALKSAQNIALLVERGTSVTEILFSIE